MPSAAGKLVPQQNIWLQDLSPNILGTRTFQEGMPAYIYPTGWEVLFHRGLPFTATSEKKQARKKIHTGIPYSGQKTSA